jgi:regulator of nucleoside diphosphate kinase
MAANTRPNSDVLDLAATKPPIRVTNLDYARLSGVVEAFELRGREPLVALLAAELDRAELVEPPAIPPDVVTMHARVRFVDESGDERTVTLVYPGEEDSEQGRIAVVTPIGSALLGLQVGTAMSWRTLDGRTKRLAVLEVLHQPEAQGAEGAEERE